MLRHRRAWVALLATYAASMTVVNLQQAAALALYRDGFHRLLQGKHGRPIRYESLLAIVADFGMDPGAWQAWGLRLADAGRVPVAAVGLAGAIGILWGRFAPRGRGPGG